MASYASPADLVARYDARTIGDLAGDAGTRVSSANILTDTNVQTALDDASGEIEAALLKGKRYTAAILAGLTGNSLALLKRICCQIAIARLWERRPWIGTDDQVSAEQALQDARAALAKLKSGEEVFDLLPQENAGLGQISTPSRVNVRARNLQVDELRGKIYPRRREPYGE